MNQGLIAIVDFGGGSADCTFGCPFVQSDDGRYRLACDGGIYNAADVLKVVGTEGVDQRDVRSVMLCAYMERGEKCLDLFNGHFAFVVWDSLERKMFVARDRFGAKPLTYFSGAGKAVFATLQREVVKAAGISQEIDLKALCEYLTFQNIFSGRTFFKGVRTFPAGHFATVNAAGRVDFLRYWDYRFEEPESRLSEGEYIEELSRLFEQAVRRQIGSSSDVGAYLSGGIDSGSVTAVASRYVPRMKTFTCGFDRSSSGGLENAFDERESAERMSYLYGTSHYEMVLKAGDMERCMARIVRAIETPKVGQSYPNYYMASLVSKFVSRVLGGAGGDELFGGYPWRYYRIVANRDFDDYIDKYYAYWQRLMPNAVLQKVLAPIAGEVKDVWTRDIFKSVFDGNASVPKTPEDYINKSLYFEAKTFMPGLLEIDDKLHRVFGVSVLAPFLDNDMVDFAMKVPVGMKLGNLGEVLRINENEGGGKAAKYFQKTRDGKLLLRKAMKRFVPEDIADGVKKGFSAPDESWYKGDSIDFVRRKLLRRDARIYDYLDAGETQRLVNEHLSGSVNRRLLIWSLLNFEYWLRIFG